MKCIQCGTDNILKDRTANSGRCKSCNHPFSFEPTTMMGPKITDPKFKKAIDDISVNGTLFFTETQLAYLLNRRSATQLGVFGCSIMYIILSAIIYLISNLISFITLSMIPFLFSILSPINLAPQTTLAIVLCLLFQLLIIWLAYDGIDAKTAKGRKTNNRMLFLIGISLGVLSASLISYPIPVYLLLLILSVGIFSVYLGFKRIQDPVFTGSFAFATSTFEDWLKRWQSLNGNIPKLLSSPKTQAEDVTISPDVNSYSFDRLIVCDRPEIAQFLIWNNFHFENNCAVLSISGYPEAIFETTMQMLYRNPNLQVYALHDCSPEGLDMISTLRTSDQWFKDRNVLILDIGLTPRQVMSAKNVLVQTSSYLIHSLRRSNWQEQGLTSYEIKWLEAGNYVELESFTPQRLMQMINLGILGSRDLVSGDDFSTGMMAGYLMSGDNFG
jgi:hypothetical protein